MSDNLKPTIHILRLRSGYDLVTAINIVNKDSVSLCFPFRVIYSSHPDTGHTIVQLVPWLSYEMFKNIKYCDLKHEEIILSSEASETMTMLYEKSLETYKDKIDNGGYVTKLKPISELIDEFGGMEEEEEEDSSESNLKDRLQ